MSHTVMIAGMVLVTVFIKAAILVLGDRIAFPPWMKEALGFVPAAVLTAIIVPMILAPHGGGIELGWRNPQLAGAVAAAAICAATGRQLLTIVAGLAVFFGWQFAG